MTPLINLVPRECAEAFARARRRSFWVTANGCAALLALCAAAVYSATQGLARGLETQMQLALDNQRQTRRQLDEVLGQCRRAGERFRLIQEMQRPQLWAARLLQLSRHAPQEVLLTSIEVEPTAPAPVAGGAAPQPPSRVGPTPSPATPPGAGTPPASAAPAPEAPPEWIVRLRGLARDHDSVLMLAEAMRGVPGWYAPKLVRASLETHAGGSLVNFQLECRSREAEVPP